MTEVLKNGGRYFHQMFGETMIELSVGMPLFNSGKIAWLALEGLCRQQDVTFEWELLIAEELRENPFGIDRIREYLPRLQNVGCRKIEYVGLNKWEALSEKWYRLANLVSSTSRGFLLQAGDCFSYPHRLAESEMLFSITNADWIQSESGIFYNIPMRRCALFRRENNLLYHPCGLNMGIRAELLKRIPSGHNVRSSVDSWLFQQIRAKQVENLISPNLLDGIDSDGFNNISKARATKIKTDFPPFEGTDYQIRDHLPPEIADRLDEMSSELEQQSAEDLKSEQPEKKAPEPNLSEDSDGSVDVKKEINPSITVGIIRSREAMFFRSYMSCLRLVHMGKLEIRVLDNREMKLSNGACRNRIVKESRSDLVIFVDDDDTVMRDMLIAMMEAYHLEKLKGIDPVCVSCFRTLVYDNEPTRPAEQRQMIAPCLWNREYLLAHPFDENLKRWIPTEYLIKANGEGIFPVVAEWNYGYIYHIHDGNMSKQEEKED